MPVSVRESWTVLSEATVNRKLSAVDVFYQYAPPALIWTSCW
ncbi:MAG: hypothetical protein ACRDS9_02120 [Pseudonocardiaceae bacterium]